ncbi:hypothetical protein [Paenibacillus lautus]|uniref:hypothetical protein n=1 Tax=Paenibacillus lautus TaxID=1401 RepID=UPI002DB8947A|nr:hypothetical protein [Paenibacillus lautus]MEC0258399.1 hypothetical protein [Paenibacillus lautus]
MDLYQWVSKNIEGDSVVIVGGGKKPVNIQQAIEWTYSSFNDNLPDSSIMEDIKTVIISDLTYINIELLGKFIFENCVIFGIIPYESDIEESLETKYASLIGEIYDNFEVHQVRISSEGIGLMFNKGSEIQENKVSKLEKIIEQKNLELLARLESEEETLLEFKNILYEYSQVEAKYLNILNKYDLLSNAKLGKLTLKYWKYKGRIPKDF